MTVMLAAMALLADATPAAAAQAAPAAAPAADAKTEVVCHRETNVGELVPRKVCVTRVKKAAPTAEAKADAGKASAKPD